MGIPQFFRWVSGRYRATLSNEITENDYGSVEFDNLYLDMNGIIHNCSHSNDDILEESLPLNVIVKEITSYIDHIVTNIVQPRKLLFIAIDGVAPRAKLNQQRARRFKSSKNQMDAINSSKLSLDANSNRRKRGKESMPIPTSSNIFDSNCITPGTIFMANLSVAIQQFISQKKSSSCPIWSKLRIIYSGHESPGEGEHKIMSFIRDMKSQPDYQPNQSHIMNGQDADMIVLALATHEPYFCVLREVVEFNRKKSAKTKVKKFQYFRVNVLRDCIFSELSGDLDTSSLDKERIIDDFVFMTFLIGNDFIPHLPTLLIGDSAFDIMFADYTELLQENFSSYIVHEGSLESITKLENLLILIARHEDSYNLLALSKNGRKNNRTKKSSPALHVTNTPTYFNALLEAISAGTFIAKGASSSAEIHDSDASSLFLAQAADESSCDYRGPYYYLKFGILIHTKAGTEELERIVKSYISGLLWCLQYYSTGCSSWSYYYPYHYAPLTEDLTSIAPFITNQTFSLSAPFTPFQQLMGCLPIASSHLLPTCYQDLMTNEHSPIHSFYPTDFKLDFDDRKPAWEAVVLLPFIDESILFACEQIFCPPSLLTAQETDRNSFRGDICYELTSEYEIPPRLAPGVAFKAALVIGTQETGARHGFPTLADLNKPSNPGNRRFTKNCYLKLSIDMNYEAVLMSISSHLKSLFPAFRSYFDMQNINSYCCTHVELCNDLHKVDVTVSYMMDELLPLAAELFAPIIMKVTSQVYLEGRKLMVDLCLPAQFFALRDFILESLLLVPESSTGPLDSTGHVRILLGIFDECSGSIEEQQGLDLLSELRNLCSSSDMSLIFNAIEISGGLENYPKFPILLKGFPELK